MKDQKGITLVALVVTIVVLLILAGVTVTYVLSDNGVFSTATQASDDTNEATAKEAVTFAILGTQTALAAPDNTKTAQDVFDSGIPDGYDCDATVEGTSITTLSITDGTISIEGSSTEYTFSYTYDGGFVWNE